MPAVDNLYPSGEEFQVVSFPQPLTPPDTDPDYPTTILVEYAPEWLEVLMAACSQLTQYAAWDGDHDAKIMAVNRAELLQLLLRTPVEIDETVPTPYWDSETDVDDEVPKDIQEWYGYVENATAPPDEISFIQDATIWILTGFVALVLSPTLPVGAAAAVTFRTLAVRFTLAFNRGDLGEQFRVIIDAKEYGTVDTTEAAEGDIIELDVNGLDVEDFHDITIIRSVTP